MDGSDDVSRRGKGVNKGGVGHMILRQEAQEGAHPYSIPGLEGVRAALTRALLACSVLLGLAHCSPGQKEPQVKFTPTTDSCRALSRGLAS